MFNLFGDKKSKAKKEYYRVLELAMQAQRSGDIKQYSFLMEKADVYKKDAGL